MTMTKRIFKCYECLGKLCSVSMITDTAVKFDLRTMHCIEKFGKKASWICIASIKPAKEDLEDK